MRDNEIDDILKRAADSQQEVDSALVDRISRSIGSSLQPVRPLASPLVLEAGLALVCWMTGIAVAVILGPHGIQKMTPLQIGVVFPVLGALVWLSAKLCVAEMIPGSLRLVAPWVLVASGSIGLIAVFAILFPDYQSERFVSQGMRCLIAGVACAIPAAGGAWLILRRGYFVNPVTAGFATGTLAGLAGVAMLELHCVNFEAPHLIVWHLAVMLSSGALGMALVAKLRP